MVWLLVFNFLHVSSREIVQALLSAIGVGEKSATVVGATFQVCLLCLPSLF